MKIQLSCAILFLGLVVFGSAMPKADHHDHHDHDHDDDEHHPTANKVMVGGGCYVDEQGISKCVKEPREVVVDGEEQEHEDGHKDHDHHNVHHMSHSLDNLWARWDALEATVCGPKADQAHVLEHRHNMRGGSNNGTWKVGDYYKSEVTTRSEDLGSSERAIFSGSSMMLENDAHVPWFRMTKSAVLILWHKGSNLLVHIIRPNGTHEEVVVGDELTDKHASYSRTFPPNTWLAIEIDGHGDGSFAFFTSVLVPGWRKEYHQDGTEDLVKLAGGHHAAMIKRLLPGAKKEDDAHHGVGEEDEDHNHHGSMNVGHHHHR
jgi:predicted cupin superfamily sugar epimerase